MAKPGYWDDVYRRSPATDVSWFQRDPLRSLELIASTGVGPNDPIVDVGGGASLLAGRLLDRGHTDVTVLDVSADALGIARQELGPRGDQVHWVAQDLLTWKPERRYRLWHDRAVFHFLTEPADQDRYGAVMEAALGADAWVVVATFAEDGPTACSGLPTARYAPDELATHFPSLRVVRVEREEHLTPGGRIQPFTWLLLRS